MNETLHIASLILYVRPSHMVPFEDWLQRETPLEIHAREALGKLVVVLEAHSYRKIDDVMQSLYRQQAVLDAVLVYHEEMRSAEAEEILDRDTNEQPVRLMDN